ncbi:MAG: uS2 family ribosomal protein, partial [Candidatus Eremiobacteraeota bacterium]|nr:uS2 family ribosomal protein [Candidatus Eremiobacteraeota bacterium]
DDAIRAVKLLTSKMADAILEGKAVMSELVAESTEGETLSMEELESQETVQELLEKDYEEEYYEEVEQE